MAAATLPLMPVFAADYIEIATLAELEAFRDEINAGNTYTDKTVMLTADSDSYTGGICGYASSGTISNCYNTGAVSGSNAIGGVVSLISTFSDSSVINCYNFAQVSGSGTKGGVIGHVRSCGTSSKISKCYFNSGAFSGDAVGLQEVSEITVEAAGKTAAEFASQGTFTDWDFTNTWEMSTALKRPILKATPEPVLPLNDTACVKITAQYTADGIMKNVKIEKIKISEIIPLQNTATSKTFYWKSLGSIKPIE